MDCLFVKREKAENNGAPAPSVSSLVKARMQAAAAGELPGSRPLLLFPEGTTTNGSFMLPFKTGAFLAGVPLQPVIIRYTKGRMSLSWETIPITRHIFLLLCQPVLSATCFELPVYVPSEEEKKDPKLYAANVRRMLVSGLSGITSVYNKLAAMGKIKEQRAMFRFACG